MTRRTVTYVDSAILGDEIGEIFPFAAARHRYGEVIAVGHHIKHIECAGKFGQRFARYPCDAVYVNVFGVVIARDNALYETAEGVLADGKTEIN